VGQGGWDGAGGDVVCWAESGSKPNGLFRFSVKNTSCLSFSGEKRGGVAKERGGVAKKRKTVEKSANLLAKKKCIIGPEDQGTHLCLWNNVLHLNL
jgi:hypothetical protein